MTRKIPDVDGIDIAFGGKAMEILPPYADIPAEFKRSSNKWARIVSDWFFRGFRDAKWTPKEGVDTRKALAAIKARLSHRTSTKRLDAHFSCRSGLTTWCTRYGEHGEHSHAYRRQQNIGTAA